MNLINELLRLARNIWGRNVEIYDEEKLESKNKCDFMLLINDCQYRKQEQGWVGTATIMASFGKSCNKNNIGELSRLYVKAQSTEGIQGISNEMVDYGKQIITLEFQFNIKNKTEIEKNYGKIEEGKFYYDNSI